MTQTDLLSQIRSGSAQKSVKEFAAQGLLPIPEDDLVMAQILLQSDQDRSISQSAQQSLEKVPESTWMRLVERKDPDPMLIQYCLSKKQSGIIREKIVLNHSIPDALFVKIAFTETGHSLDIIINNHVRLLRDPEILKSLESNRSLSIDQKRRIEEFKTEFIFKKQQQAEREAIAKASIDEICRQIPGLDAETRKAIEEADALQEAPLSDAEVAEALSTMFSTDEMQHLPEEIVSVYQRIMKMNQGEKIRLALLGNKEERGLLIRDRSRQVSGMVLRSPKLTETEVENFSQMRNLDSELLRQLGQNRAFLKRYSVIYNLVKNPKTPSPVSLNLLKLLRILDLRNLERDKNIPDVIRRQAQRMREVKETQKN